MRSERASVTVLTMAILGAITILAFALAASGALLAAWSKASAAADAAALAAAPLTFQPSGSSPAYEAAVLAKANGGRLLTCRCPGDRSYRARTVEVVVEVIADLPVVGSMPVRATSRAEFAPLDIFKY